MQQIIFLLTTGLKHPFYGSLHDEIVFACAESKFPLPLRFEAVVKQDEYGALAAVMKLQKLAEEKVLDDAAALVVVPMESRGLTEEVVKVQSRRRGQGRPLPVIALNLPFQCPDEFGRRGLPVPKVVASHDNMAAAELGKHAASRLAGGLRSPVRVVLIPGQHDRIDSRRRCEGFLAGLKEGIREAQQGGRSEGPEDGLEEGRAVIKTDETMLAPCSWNRALAADAMTRHLQSEPTSWVDVVFAANDEMALGARDAILSAGDRFQHKVAGCVVYGYDGIDEAIRLVEEGDTIFGGTVEQNLPEMAARLVKVLRGVLDGNALDARPEYIPAEARLQRPGSRPPTPEGWAPPDYDPASGEWVPAKEAAKRDRVSQDVLRHARSRRSGRQRVRCESGSDAVRRRGWVLGGMDRDGRIWIKTKSEKGHTLYLASSLTAGDTRLGPVAAGRPAGTQAKA